MALSLQDCIFTGPALPEPFVQFELEKELTKRKLLPKATGQVGQDVAEHIFHDQDVEVPGLAD